MHEFSTSDVFLPLHLFHHFPQQYRLSECHSILKFGSVEVRKKRRENRALQQKRLSTRYFCLPEMTPVCTEGSVPPAFAVWGPPCRVGLVWNLDSRTSPHCCKVGVFPLFPPCAPPGPFLSSSETQPVKPAKYLPCEIMRNG
ncbi:hypothetical protein AMECASPLE_028129 [Ameca splendens]|uniref:Uncharacterized protein n=1 Tax=Ameca splendens TaxID=208324 RepID=A0ABV1ADU0_9TELE